MSARNTVEEALQKDGTEYVIFDVKEAGGHVFMAVQLTNVTTPEGKALAGWVQTALTPKDEQ